jgi:tripartite ATP-independent transporter DctM subunit
MNGLNNVIRILDKVGVFSRWTNVIGLAALFLMVSLTFVDVIMRYIFNSPIRYVLEVVEIMMITAVFLAVAHTQNEKGHVSVDVITSKLAPRPRIVLESITSLLGLGIFAIFIWQNVAEIPWTLSNNVVHSQSFHVSKAPFLAIIALGSTALWLLLLRDLLSRLVEAMKLGASWYHWLLMFGVPALVLVLAMLWMQPKLWEMSLATVGVIGVIVSLILFLGGMPISFALILTSLVFVSHIRGTEIALDMLGTEPYRNAGSYGWSVMAFFVLMGFLCFFAKFGEDLYRAAYRWFGQLRGGLSIATVGACAGLSAIVGDTISVVATMAAVSLPEMRKYKYDDRLSAGAITGGATLGPIIPPSVPFIIYGLLTRESIGDLFIAGIIPGLILAAVFSIVIYGWCRLNPGVGPPGERSGWVQRFTSLKAGGPVAILFLVVIGGIYMGVFTPTEGGAIGAMGAVFLGLIWRRFTWRAFSQSLLESGKVISMVFLILIGAVMFTRFVVWCNLHAAVSDFFTGLGLPPFGILLIIELVLFALGFVVDTLALMLIGVPIVHPIAVALGFDPIWFAVVTLIAINMGTITPPVALNLFALKAVAQDIPMGTIFRGALPFVLGMAVVLALLIAVPPLVTWLPNILK